jgi:hypothetical protein
MFGWIVSRGAALSASLVLHIILLFFAYYLQKDSAISQLIPETKELIQKKDFEWAATEAAPSQFGTPIEFQSISESAFDQASASTTIRRDKSPDKLATEIKKTIPKQPQKKLQKK